MRSLFIKIFLWFWLTLMLVNVAFFLSVFLINNQDRAQRTPPWHELTAATIGIYAETAAEIFERDGGTALAGYLERVERTSRVHAVVFNQRGEEVSGRPVPEGAQEIAARAAQSGKAEFNFSPNQGPGPPSPPPPPPPVPTLAAQTVRSTQGNQYTLVGEMPAPLLRRPQPGFEFRSQALHLLIILIIGGIFCYWLARYITSPVIKLRRTTQELASGNLQARVSSRLVKQRDEIGSLSRDFNIMAGRIESLVMAQRRLLADISHELRSPLARLGVALELARRRAGADASASLDRIAREAESINEMIGQLLTLSRVESDPERLTKVNLDLCALVRDISDDADFEARSRNCSVRLTTDSESCAARGVAELLRSAVENVVRNAVHYTQEGTEVEVTLRCKGAEGEAVISVRDHGRGVPEEAIAEIFRPFYRVEDARDRQSGGTGLGLAIAARAVRLHQGTITAANAEDGGLIVEIKIPLG